MSACTCFEPDHFEPTSNYASTANLPGEQFIAVCGHFKTHLLIEHQELHVSILEVTLQLGLLFLDGSHSHVECVDDLTTRRQITAGQQTQACMAKLCGTDTQLSPGGSTQNV